MGPANRDHNLQVAMAQRAVAADLTPSVRSRLERAGLEVTPTSADHLLAEAESIDAQLVVISRRAATRALISQTNTRTTAASDHGLSARELDVLRLLATGKENAEIARTLVISPKTVKNHVSRILNKLGLKNRVEAAVFAVRQNLD